MLRFHDPGGGSSCSSSSQTWVWPRSTIEN
jgi:hypothetical protein